MSKKNSAHYSHEGSWVQAQDLFVGTSDEWKRARIKLIGASGKWIEVYDNEQTTMNSTDVDQLSYRAGTPWQGDLQLIGRGLSGIPAPYPDNFYYFPMRSNLTENVSNSANLIGYSNDLAPVVPTTENGGGYELIPAKEQFIRVPTDVESGVDLKGMLGITEVGQRMWLMGIQFMPYSLPPAGELRHVIYAGIPNQRISLSYNNQGDVVFTWNGSPALSITLPAECEVGRWTGIWIKHTPGATPNITMKSDRGNIVQHNGTIPYFMPTLAEASAAIQLGKGEIDGGTAPNPNYFNTGTVHSALTITNALELYYTAATYRGAQPGDVILPGTGTYYIEASNRTSYDLQIGVAEPGADLSQPPGLVGWVVNTINGRKFDHQTGGGTNWSTATPANSRIGLLYDSDNGQIEYFVNGVSRGRPFPVGEITVPVKFIIGGRGNTATSAHFNPLLAVESSQWTYTAAGAKQFPYAQIVTASTAVYFDGMLRGYFVRNEPYTTESVQDALINPTPTLNVVWKNRNTNDEFVATHLLMKQTDSQIIMTVPDLTPGDYEVFVRTDEGETGHKAFTIVPFGYTTNPLHIDFATTPKSVIRQHLIRAHKAWGGLNGGVVAENIIHDEVEGVLKIRACGDQYTGPITGVDRIGNPVARTTRIGGCIVTRDYFGPGSYRLLAKLPIQDGVVSAFWTFHYEEGYAGHPLYDEHINDGIRRTGSTENGYYTVRNHEIDIEIPTALKGAPDMEIVDYHNARFNTWRGENRNWDVAETDPEYWTEYTDDFINHGVETNDGQFHEFRFDWHLEGTPRVEFYIDGVLKHTVYDTIPDIPGRFWMGLWFPSAVGNHWAGKTADFVEEWMEIKEIHIIPYSTFGVRSISESYPNDVFRDMYDN